MGNLTLDDIVELIDNALAIERQLRDEVNGIAIKKLKRGGSCIEEAILAGKYNHAISVLNLFQHRIRLRRVGDSNG